MARRVSSYAFTQKELIDFAMEKFKKDLPPRPGGYTCWISVACSDEPGRKIIVSLNVDMGEVESS